MMLYSQETDTNARTLRSTCKTKRTKKTPQKTKQLKATENKETNKPKVIYSTLALNSNEKYFVEFQFLLKYYS